MLSELRPNGVAQLNLFDDEAPRAGSEALMNLLDSMNRSGRYSIGFAGKGIDPGRKMKREMLRKAWMTNWKELPVAKLIWHSAAGLFTTHHYIYNTLREISISLTNQYNNVYTNI